MFGWLKKRKVRKEIKEMLNFISNKDKTILDDVVANIYNRNSLSLAIEKYRILLNEKYPEKAEKIEDIRKKRGSKIPDDIYDEWLLVFYAFNFLKLEEENKNNIHRNETFTPIVVDSKENSKDTSPSDSANSTSDNVSYYDNGSSFSSSSFSSHSSGFDGGFSDGGGV